MKKLTVMMFALALLGAGCDDDDDMDTTSDTDAAVETDASDDVDESSEMDASDDVDESSEMDASDDVDESTEMDASDDMDASTDDMDAGEEETADPSLVRLATVALGAEITGMEKTANGEFFFNVQHPDDSLANGEGAAAVGAWTGVNVDELAADLESLPVPDGADKETTKVVEGAYQVLGREGDTMGGDLPSGLGHILAADGVTEIKQSNDPDFNAFIPSNDDGSEGYLFTAWEDRPGGMTRLALSKADDGSWTVGTASNVDFSAVKGTMINCFGSVSPWGTPLTSEENYEAENAAAWNDASYSDGYPNYADVQAIQTYLGGTYPNPYDYGYIVEITDPTGTPTPVKHFTLGRSAHENAVVMPDQRTVYTTSDGTGQSFYKFVANTAGDLSAGTLYAAKVTQDDSKDPAVAGFDLEWIMLGASNNAAIEALIDTYDGIDETAFVADSTNFVTQEAIDAYDPTTDANELAFIETARVARALGASSEFDKMEGININYAGVESGEVPYMYVAMSDVRNMMVDTEGDIQLDPNRCGVVYRFTLGADYDTARMEPVVAGGEIDEEATVNQCPVGYIAQPDNVAVLNDGRVLIGEDTGNHENNMLWLWTPAE